MASLLSRKACTVAMPNQKVCACSIRNTFACTGRPRRHWRFLAERKASFQRAWLSQLPSMRLDYILSEICPSRSWRFCFTNTVHTVVPQCLDCKLLNIKYAHGDLFFANVLQLHGSAQLWSKRLRRTSEGSVWMSSPSNHLKSGKVLVGLRLCTAWGASDRKDCWSDFAGYFKAHEDFFVRHEIQIADKSKNLKVPQVCHWREAPLALNCALTKKIHQSLKSKKW